MTEDIQTPMGVVRGGLPHARRADVALVSEGDGDGMVSVYAVAPRALQVPVAGAPASERALEVIAAFSMDEEMFIASFSAVIDSIQSRKKR